MSISLVMEIESKQRQQQTPNSTAAASFGCDNQSRTTISNSAVLLQMSINGRTISSGLRRQPTKYPHGLGISVAIENTPAYHSTENTDNWSTAQHSTTAIDKCNGKRYRAQSQMKSVQANSMESKFPSKTLVIIMEYLKTICKWKFVKWPVILLCSTLMLSIFTTYCLWPKSHINNIVNIPTNASSYANDGILRKSVILTTLSTRTTEQKINEFKTKKKYQEYGMKEPLHTMTTPSTQTTILPDLARTARPKNRIRFTSGHQNSFGVPIEEDERILKFINKLLPKSTAPFESNTFPSTKVSPTIPPLSSPPVNNVTPSKSQQRDENGCSSTSLPMCHGVLQYDLTSNLTLPLSQQELDAYQGLVASNCSARSIEFICSSLEPECRPLHIGIVSPCKRICKSILESCSIEISSSDALSAMFDCDLYPDSNDPHVCEDPTRRRGYCYTNEFECFDSSCIPHQWHCDNIKDCASGEDEDDCLLCDQEDEFRCHSNEKCISESMRCDLNFDCFDGSDEEDCDDDGSGEEMEFDRDALSSFPRVFSYASFLSPNQTNGKFYTYITAAEDDVSGTRIQVRKVENQTEEIATEEIINDGPKGFVNFRDSKEIMMTSDTENKLKYSSSGKNLTSVNNESDQILVQENIRSDCQDNQLRCVSGHCITVDQLCDKVIDCPDGADELMCVYDDTQTTARNKASTTKRTTTRATARTTAKTAKVTQTITTRTSRPLVKH